MCPSLSSYSTIVIIAALAYPPLFHFFVRGQISALVLACFSAALLAFRSDRNWLAGIALGLLVFKPQFLIAVPLVLLLSRSWIPFASNIASAAEITVEAIHRQRTWHAALIKLRAAAAQQ